MAPNGDPNAPDGDSSAPEAGPASTSTTSTSTTPTGDKGTVASHPERFQQPFLVAPTTAAAFNTLGLDLVPVACLSLPDILFDFDSSFPHVDSAAILAQLDPLRQKHKSAKGTLPSISVFGHADPVGEDEFNKALSGRRARAIYGLLTHDLKIWEQLFNEEWSAKGVLPGVRKILGAPASEPRAQVFQDFMNKLVPTPVPKGDFLGGGADPKGVADFQGCSDFNPLVVLSTSENKAFTTEERNEKNQPDRRVVIFIFRPGPKVNTATWPCPAATEGTAKCRKRFFVGPPAGDQRRKVGPVHKEFSATKDTFACRFYDRIARLSPCEDPTPPVILGVNPEIFFLGPQTVTTASPGAQAASSSASSLVSSVNAPNIALTRNIVLVKKPYTNPKRAEVLLKTDTPFDGTGLFNVDKPDTIAFFPTATSTAPLTFNNIDNKFTGAQLLPTGPGVKLFAEGKNASVSMRDVLLTLKLSGGTKKPGPDATGRMTSIELLLDICAPRVNATTAPVPLPQAPKTTSVKPTDKFFLGRPVPIQDDAKIQERAMIMVQPVKTAGFTNEKVRLTLTRKGANVTTFTQETPSNTDVVVAQTHALFSTSTPTTFFVEGVTASTKARDVEYRLGIEGMDDDGDRVQVTVVHAEIVSNKEPKDVPTVDIVPEKPLRKSDSKFFPAPIIIGRNFPIELRTFLKLATASAFQWTASGAPILSLTDATKDIVKVVSTGGSTALNDTTLQVRFTTDLGDFLRRHRQTVVRVTIDPVTSGDNVKPTDAINLIKNPSCCVILPAPDKTNANIVPKYEITKIEPDLTFTDDDDRIAWWILGGEATGDNKYDGKAAFMNTEAAKRGTKIQASGLTTGDILIQPYSGGFGYGMIRVHVAALRLYKYRVSRIFTQAQAAQPQVNALPGFPQQVGQPAFPGGGGVAPQPQVPDLPAVPSRPLIPAVPGRTAQGPTQSHVEADLHIKVANIFLRQIGYQLIPDDSAEVANPKRAAKPGFALVAAQPQILQQPATPAIPGSPPRPSVPARPAILQRPQILAVNASVGNPRVGQDALDTKVVNATLISKGHFDVEVNDINLTFNSSANQRSAIRINARNEVINFAYIEQDPTFGAGKVTLATALLCPANHAPKTRARQPEGAPNQAGTAKAYNKANFTLPDLGTPSTSILPKTGIPPDTPAGKVNLVVLFPDVNWQPNTPANRDVDLLWGIIVPTRNMDGAVPALPAATLVDRTRHMYGFVFAHEMGHILGLGHRGKAGDTAAKKDPVSDGLDNPPDKNIMRALVNPPVTENFDLIQAKAVRFSEVNFRSP